MCRFEIASKVNDFQESINEMSQQKQRISKISIQNELNNRCVLGSGEFFGEETFLTDDGKTFILKLFNIFTIRSSKVKCSIMCRSQCGQVLRISREDIIKQFIKQILQEILRMKKHNQFLFHCYSRFINLYYEEMTDDKLKQINGQEGIDQFVRPMFKVKVRNNCALMKKESQQDRSDIEYQFYKKQEKKPFEQFKKLFKDRNCSYAQVKTFFDQKIIKSQNYIDSDSYFKLFFRFPSQLKNSEVSKSISQQQPSTARIHYRLTTQPILLA